MQHGNQGLKVQGYNLADDADSVLGPANSDASSNNSTIDLAFSNRDDDGNIAFPGRYSGREEPAFRQPSETAPPPGENSSWPPKNEDGSYQLAPGAKLKFGPPSDQKAQAAARVITHGTGALLGAALTAPTLNPQLGAVFGGMMAAPAEGLVEDIIKQGRYPHIEIGGGSTSAISAQDYPNGNRMDD